MSNPCFHLIFSLEPQVIRLCADVIRDQDKIYIIGGSIDSLTDVTVASIGSAFNKQNVFWVCNDQNKFTAKMKNFNIVSYDQFVQAFTPNTITKSWG